MIVRGGIISVVGEKRKKKGGSTASTDKQAELLKQHFYSIANIILGHIHLY